MRTVKQHFIVCRYDEDNFLEEKSKIESRNARENKIFWPKIFVDILWNPIIMHEYIDSWVYILYETTLDTLLKRFSNFWDARKYMRIKSAWKLSWKEKILILFNLY